ncbi:hypothetical protein [Streptomyces collinus]|uniref:hypothetical protein n=1 Tax=Streptomyces collinus TaxID=42684 RepID=UPI0011DD38AA|nr:hypothetical protein [Streptomyces collinus]
MTTTPAMPTAHKRRRKTRTSNINHRPPIIVSGLKANELDLTPGKEHLVCPDCSTWVPITGMLGTPKLVPHHTGQAGTAGAHRCTGGTNRRVTLDVEVDAWRTKLIEAAPTTASRRATKVLRKPKTTQPPAASQITPVSISAERVRQAFRRHKQQCPACRGEATARDGEPLPCRDGERLAVTFLRLLRQEPKRQAVREVFARERQRFDRHYTVAAPAKRKSQWAAVLPKVQDADTRRAQLPAGDAPTEARNVPLETLHPMRGNAN